MHEMIPNLVTGSAGFITFHLSAGLIVSVYNIRGPGYVDSYYDEALNEALSKNLIKIDRIGI